MCARRFVMNLNDCARQVGLRGVPSTGVVRAVLVDDWISLNRCGRRVLLRAVSWDCRLLVTGQSLASGEGKLGVQDANMKEAVPSCLQYGTASVSVRRQGLEP